ncbi:hypothetical protein J4481_01605 [Candidatus Pacearchaeota archaeon]|nr:hypothetical protein [Candidatus Pacearchaeota archaeon]
MNTKTKTLIFTLPLLLVATMFLVSAISITDMSSSPDQVAPGETFSISLDLENIFEYDVQNLQIKLDLTGETPFAPYQSSSEKFLDDLDEGDEESFSFKLITLPETKSGIYKIPVQINYEYLENETIVKSSKQELISVIVNSAPELSLSLNNEITLIKGIENTISVRIVNSGLADIKFLYLETSEVSGIDFISENEQYVGDVDSDDFDEVDYRVYISPTASNTINLPLTLKFKDATNKEFTLTKTIEVKTYSLNQAQELGLVKKPNYIIYFVITILVLTYILYRVLKKRKKRR